MPFGRVFCDVQAYVSCRGYDGISQRAQLGCESRWHRGLHYSSLTKLKSFVRGFFITLTLQEVPYEILSYT